LTPTSLPPAHTKRWVASRKAAIVAAVREGLISLDDACRRYALSADELLAWRSTFDSAGQSGLQIRRLQDNRRS
jgi:transposase-like protein